MNEEISVATAARLLKDSKSLFVELFKHGSLVVEFYKPAGVDNQKPHNRDEVYVIASGKGTFNNDGRKFSFKTGDFLFVPAGVPHHFEKFSKDFATWVFFYGPIGGERK